MKETKDGTIQNQMPGPFSISHTSINVWQIANVLQTLPIDSQQIRNCSRITDRGAFRTLVFVKIVNSF